MTDQDNLPQPAAGETADQYYEETVVEYVDNTRRRRMLAALLVILFLLLIGVGYFVVRISQPAGSPDQASLPPGITWIRSFYSWGPGANQLLQSPTATAIGPDGTIWTLASKQYIIGYSPTGQVRAAITPTMGQGKGQVQTLEGIAVGSDGAVYVTDFGNNRIDVFSPNGQLLRSWGVQLPQVIYVKGDRVAVAAANGIGIFDTQGNLISKWGSRGPGEEQVDLPHGILIGNDNLVYVSDTQNRRVKAYDQSGRLLWVKADPNKTGRNLMSTNATIPTSNGIDQGMLLPTGLAQDAAGRLLMTDAFNFQIVVMDPKKKGLIVARYGEEGQQDGKFAYPTGLAYDARRDLIAVADTTNNRVQVIRLPGTGGNVVSRTLTSITDTPIWLCLIPLILLVLAFILWILRRRGEEADDRADEHDEETLPLAD